VETTGAVASADQGGEWGTPRPDSTIWPDQRDQLLVTVVDAARRLGISRSLLYELLACGEIESVHVGRLRRVPVESLAEYVSRLRRRDVPAGATLNQR